MYSMMTIVNNTLLNTGNCLESLFLVLHHAQMVPMSGEDTLISMTTVIISQYICISYHHAIHRKYMHFF